MASRAHAHPGRLLVVDDNRVNRLLLGRALEQLGHTVAFAEHGREALATLRTQPVDLMLLDIEMPEMDGYQVLEALRADPNLGDVPVVMMSSVEEVDSVARCIEMGAEDYLFKPVNPVLLRARVGASLEKKRLRDHQRELIRKFATSEVAEELLGTGFALGGKHVDASVMFSDIRGFTRLAEALSPADTIELLNSYYTLMFDAIGGQGGIVNQMLGDGLMAVFGAPLPRADHRERAVRAALEMLELVDGFDKEQSSRGGPQVRIGIGIASGPVIAGFTGTQQRVTYTCVGDTVNLAAHLEAHEEDIEADRGKVLFISRSGSNVADPAFYLDLPTYPGSPTLKRALFRSAANRDRYLEMIGDGSLMIMFGMNCQWGVISGPATGFAGRESHWVSPVSPPSPSNASSAVASRCSA